LPMLPGVAAPLPLLPLYVIRGDSPGMNGFFLDGMRLPQLFHLLIGGGVVHPRLIDRIDFYPGAYDASFGHYAGGIVSAETRAARSDGQHGEVELRLFDVSTLGEASLPHGVRVAVAGRYGYPGPIFHLFDQNLDVAYGDYFARIDWRGLTIEGLGSYDRIKAYGFNSDLRPSDLGNELRQTFHRVQVRGRMSHRRLDLEAALSGGYDEANGLNGTGVRKLSLDLRANLRARFRHFVLRAGIDGELAHFTAEKFVDSNQPAPATIPDEYGDLAGDRDGGMFGAFLLGTLELPPAKLLLTVGARADVYYAAGVTLLGIDPRISAEMKPLPQLTLRAGFGVYHQPPSFPVALPGIDTFALSLGLQEAWQGAVTIEAAVPWALQLSLTGYYQRFYNITDAIPDLTDYVTCRGPAPGSLGGLAAQLLRQNDGAAYGMELLVRREKGRLTGWIAYTLGRSERNYSCGLRPADFDQTHVLNIVMQVRLPWKLMAGVHWYFATGRPVTVLYPPDPESTPRNNERLPSTFEVDLRLDREWMFRRWALSAFIELLNLNYGSAYYGIYYPKPDPLPHLDQPQRYGFRWILPSVGLRGRF
jgi:hypothetical protein